MTYKQIIRIASWAIRLTLIGGLVYFLYLLFGTCIIFIALGVLTLLGLVYFLCACIGAGLDNKFGEFDRCMQNYKEPQYLPPHKKQTPCE